MMGSARLLPLLLLSLHATQQALSAGPPPLLPGAEGFGWCSCTFEALPTTDCTAPVNKTCLIDMLQSVLYIGDKGPHKQSGDGMVPACATLAGADTPARVEIYEGDVAAAPKDKPLTCAELHIFKQDACSDEGGDFYIDEPSTPKCLAKKKDKSDVQIASILNFTKVMENRAVDPSCKGVAIRASCQASKENPRPPVPAKKVDLPDPVPTKASRQTETGATEFCTGMTCFTHEDCRLITRVSGGSNKSELMTFDKYAEYLGPDAQALLTHMRSRKEPLPALSEEFYKNAYEAMHRMGSLNMDFQLTPEKNHVMAPVGAPIPDGSAEMKEYFKKMSDNRLKIRDLEQPIFPGAGKCKQGETYALDSTCSAFRSCNSTTDPNTKATLGGDIEQFGFTLTSMYLLSAFGKLKVGSRFFVGFDGNCGMSCKAAESEEKDAAGSGDGDGDGGGPPVILIAIVVLVMVIAGGAAFYMMNAKKKKRLAMEQEAAAAKQAEQEAPGEENWDGEDTTQGGETDFGGDTTADAGGETYDDYGYTEGE